MKTIIKGQQFDEERALYHLQNAQVVDCVFAGPADGESAFKEARGITAESCAFSLRYPFWHTEGFSLTGCSMDEKARAAIWYARDGSITDCRLHGIKAVRECENIRIDRCSVISPEFGWKSKNIHLADTSVEAEYLLLDSRDVTLERVQMKGKYSFQYIENLQITDSFLDTKDAFWHSRNVTVRNCVIKGEYLAWFSEGLTLVGCHIIGTQPLCYCKDLTLIDCTMEGTDLAFEYSDVQATVKGHIHSIKNPRSGCITADSVGEIIMEDAVMECTGRVHIR